MNDINERALTMLNVEIDKVKLDMEYFPGPKEDREVYMREMDESLAVLYYLKSLVNEKIERGD